MINKYVSRLDVNYTRLRRTAYYKHLFQRSNQCLRVGTNLDSRRANGDCAANCCCLPDCCCSLVHLFYFNTTRPLWAGQKIGRRLGRRVRVLLTRKRSGLGGVRAEPSAPGCCSPPNLRCRYSSGRRAAPKPKRGRRAAQGRALNNKDTDNRIQIVPGTPPFCIHK